ncbi:MAG: hypothetical protein Q9193_000464, partial [Seirophora villosa]
ISRALLRNLDALVNRVESCAGRILDAEVLPMKRYACVLKVYHRRNLMRVKRSKSADLMASGKKIHAFVKQKIERLDYQRRCGGFFQRLKKLGDDPDDLHNWHQG